MEYYAKSPVVVSAVGKSDEGKERTERVRTEHKTLREHLEETVRCAERFFDQYGNIKLLTIILQLIRVINIRSDMMIIN